MNDAIAVANHATHFNILMILSPVGVFCDIINLILINNFSISIANIQFFLIYANFLILFWSYIGVILEFIWISRVGKLGTWAWLVALDMWDGRGQAQVPSLAGGFAAGVFGLGSLGWICGMEEVKPESPAPVGRIAVGVFFFGSLCWLCVLEEVKEKSPTQEGRFADEVFFFGSLCWLCVLEEVKEKSSSPAGRTTKSSKVTKIPISIYNIGSSNDSRNTSREQPRNQTNKKIIYLYVILNNC